MKYLHLVDADIPLKWSPNFKQKSLCPRLLYLLYGKKERRDLIRPNLERGGAAHSALEELLGYVLDERMDISDLDNSQLAEAVERHTPHEIIGDMPTILTWLHLWRERFEIRRPETVIGVEERIALDDDYDACEWSDASYRGILDLLEMDDDTAVITDWKSQFNILSASDLQTHEPTTFYSWLVWKQYPYIKRFITKIWYLRYGYYSVAERNVEELELFEDNLLMHERKILTLDNIDPVPGVQCSMCDYILDCPLAIDLSPDNENIVGQEQAVLAAQRLTVMEALVKTTKAKLKEYVDANDEILTANNWVYGYKAGTTEEWEAEEVLPVLEKHGFEIASVVNIDKYKMRRLLKQAEREELEDFLADMSAVTGEKPTPQFKGYQRTPK